MNSPHEFRRLLDAAHALQSAGDAGALATLVRTVGSTYRRAGASMLVGANGEVTCPLAGGCPQNDLVQRALHIIAADVPEIARYDRETSLDVLIETGCDGELEVFIEPLARAQDLRFLDALAAVHERRDDGCMATVYACNGAPLSPRPQRLIATGDGTEWCDIESASLSDRVLAIGRRLRGNQHATTQRLTMNQIAYDVLFEPLQPPHQLVIFGANAGALALARQALFLGWTCVMADPAPRNAACAMTDVRFVRAAPDAVRQSITFDDRTSVVTMTHNLERDTRFLASLAGIPCAYLGMIGSRERAARIRARLPATLHVNAPAGLDIGAETPEEIALAVAAEILARTHARTAHSLAASAASMHA